MLKKFLMIPALFCLAVACKQKPSNLHLNVNVAANTDKEIKVKPEQLIIPGESIGNTHINEDLDSVFVKLGRSDYTDAAMGASFNTWYTKHDTSSYQTDVYAHHNYDGKHDAISYVKLIRVTSPWFKTEQNLGAGLPLREISKHFKLNYVKAYAKGNDTLRVYDDAESGIAFEINKLKKCAAIMVHIKNDTISSYLSMHPKMQEVDIKNKRL